MGVRDRLFLYLLLVAVGLGDVAFAIKPATAHVSAGQVETSDVELSLQALDQLISATEQSLAAQRQIREQLSGYGEMKSHYLQDQQNRELVLKLVKAANALQAGIESNRLTDPLDGELLHELAFFSQIAKKKSLPKP